MKLMRCVDVTQLVECNLAKVDVAGSSPVIHSQEKFRNGLDKQNAIC